MSIRLSSRTSLLADGSRIDVLIFGEQFLKEFDLFSKIDLDRPKDKVTDEVCREDTDNTSKFRYCRCSSPMYGRQCSTVHSSRRISTEDAHG